jgi:hypothetical protein
MGYNVEISINILKETKFSEVDKTIQDIAEFYSCDNIYSLSEEDGTKKIPRYHCIYVISFIDDNFDNLIKFLKFIKKNKSSYIECIYENDIYKLLYASSFYLKSIDKELSKTYKQFIKDKNFTPNETKLLRELI